MLEGIPLRINGGDGSGSIPTCFQRGGSCPQPAQHFSVARVVLKVGVSSTSIPEAAKPGIELPGTSVLIADSLGNEPPRKKPY